MLSDNTFRGIGYFEEDTSSAETSHLRLGAKALLKSVSRPLYTMATLPLDNACRKCTSRLPLLWHPNVSVISVLHKGYGKVQWPDNATKAKLYTARKSLNISLLNYYNADDYAVCF